MRIREFMGNRFTKIYSDNKKLGQNTGNSIKDYKQICCQITINEDNFTNHHILLNVSRWYPEKFMFGKFEEISLLKNTKIKSELREIISKYSQINIQDIRIEHPRPYELKINERKKLCILDWNNDKCNDHSTLISEPWTCKDGDYILFKNNQEQERYNLKDFDQGPMQSISFLREEKPLIFYSPEEQIAREKEEEERKQKLEEDKLKNQQDAIERFAQNEKSTTKYTTR